MKLLLDDKQHCGYDLNANEACIFAAILKCTRAGRGWYGNYRELADAMPFVINRTTVYRAIQKLLNLGLIEERENKTLFAVQIAQESVQNEHESVQNAQESVQNALPPNNPPINNNMNEKEKEQPRALCARDGDEQQGADLSFEKFWKFFSVGMPNEFHNRYGATKIAFEQRSEVAQRAMIEAAQEGAPGHPGDEQNPYFFVQDFPEPQPVFLRGDEPGDIVQVRYNGAYKLCTRATMELFGLEWVRDW
ncbi:MAG: hypothetical protein IKS76_02230 [Paludibacteraceae bacterium]|nr:hypothetical protein [Paludibacteraceae bacterium]MBR6492570.1 hypothetical protein [Paludibacteraceae bacterium]